MHKKMPYYTISYEIFRPFWLLFLVQIGRYRIIKTGEYWDDPSYGNGGGSWEIGTWTVAKYFDFKKAQSELKKLQVLNMPGQEERWHPSKLEKIMS